jgi:hypothetical protein
MGRLQNYWQGLQQHAGFAWNEFWFTPSSVRDLSILRIAVGVLALVWQLSFTADLQSWFGPQGWLDSGVVIEWNREQVTRTFSGRLSFLWAQQPAVLWAAHFAVTAVLLSFTCGLFTRATSVLSFLALLGYVHRAPFLGGAAEPVLTMLVGYLCVAPCGRYFSLDARRLRASLATANRLPLPSVSATIARRLIQVHLVMFYLVMFTTKLAGATWWNGEALWWLSVQPLVPSPDPSFLRSQPVILNFLTYVILISEFGVVMLSGNRWFRPLALGASTFSWCILAGLAGTWPLSATMLVANLVFWNAPTGEPSGTK